MSTSGNEGLRQSWVVAAALVLLLVGLIVSLEGFLSGAEGEWAAAIQLATTIVLVIVTAVYALLTHRLAVTSEKHLDVARLAQHDETVRELAQFMASDVLHVVSRWRPRLDSLAGKPPSEAREHLENMSFEFHKLSQRLIEYGNQFPPSPIGVGCWKSAALVEQTTLGAAAILGALGLAEEQHGEPPDWDQVKATFFTKVRDETPDVLGEPYEWNDFFDGSYLDQAEEAISELNVAVNDYIEANAMHVMRRLYQAGNLDLD